MPTAVARFGYKNGRGPKGRYK